MMIDKVYKHIESIKNNFFVYLSILGAFIVAHGQTLPANLIWSVSNPMLAYHNYKIGEKEQCKLFLVFTVVAWWGVLLAYLGKV